MSLSLPGSEGPQTLASPTGGYTMHGFHELFCRERPRNRRGGSQVHITRRRFNMTFPLPPSLPSSGPMCQGRRERRTTVAAALMNLKHSRTTFFSPSFPLLLCSCSFHSRLRSLSRPCLCIGNSPGGRRWQRQDGSVPGSKFAPLVPVAGNPNIYRKPCSGCR